MAEHSDKEPDEARTELLAHRQFLEGEPLAEVQDAELEAIKQSGPSHEGLAPKLARFYDRNGDSEINVAGIGWVRLDLRAVRNSQWHGNQPERLAAFVVVPEVLKKGRLVETEPMRDAPKGRFYHIAAPIRIFGEAFIAVAQVKSPPPRGITRLYVHQVFSREKLRRPSELRATNVGKPTKQTSGKEGAGAAETLLRRIYSVKERESAR